MTCKFTNRTLHVKYDNEIAAALPNVPRCQISSGAKLRVKDILKILKRLQSHSESLKEFCERSHKILKPLSKWINKQVQTYSVLEGLFIVTSRKFWLSNPPLSHFYALSRRYLCYKATSPFLCDVIYEWSLSEPELRKRLCQTVEWSEIVRRFLL